MRRTLYDVQRALKGLLVMSSDLEDVANCIFTQAVPGVWESVGYLSNAFNSMVCRFVAPCKIRSTVD